MRIHKPPIEGEDVGRHVVIREVTDDETAYFRENGWAKLPGLIDSATASKLLERAKARMGTSGAEHAARPNDFAPQGVRIGFHDYTDIDRDDALFRAVLLNPQMGRNAALMFGRDIAIRTMNNMLAVKLPSATQKAKSGISESRYHQDQPATAAYCSAMIFWIALTDLTPDMGTMRFYEGSHKLGLLTPPALDWPQVSECPLSQPIALKSGDATVHHSLVVHGAPANTTERSRWAYLTKYFPADAPYSAGRSLETDGHGLEFGKPLEHPRFPVVYAGPTAV